MNQMSDRLIEYEVDLEGKTITYSYDKEGDILELFFNAGGGFGVDLADNVVLRYNRDSETALSLILTNFSYLTQPTKFGPLSFHLTALNNLPQDMQHIVLNIITSFPVNRFLKISDLLLPTYDDPQPITFLERPKDLLLDRIPA